MDARPPNKLVVSLASSLAGSNCAPHRRESHRGPLVVRRVARQPVLWLTRHPASRAPAPDILSPVQQAPAFGGQGAALKLTQEACISLTHLPLARALGTPVTGSESARMGHERAPSRWRGEPSGQALSLASTAGAAGAYELSIPLTGMRPRSILKLDPAAMRRRPRRVPSARRKGQSVDICDPITGNIRSASTGDVACWFIDTSYKGVSIFAPCILQVGWGAVRQAQTGAASQDRRSGLGRTLRNDESGVLGAEGGEDRCGGNQLLWGCSAASIHGKMTPSPHSVHYLVAFLNYPIASPPQHFGLVSASSRAVTHSRCLSRQAQKVTAQRLRHGCTLWHWLHVAGLSAQLQSLQHALESLFS